MMKFKLRIQETTVVVTFPGSQDEQQITIEDLAQLIQEKRGDTTLQNYGLTFGFPPKTISTFDYLKSTLSDIGLRRGSLVTVSKMEESSSGPWTCPTCTYSNDVSRTSCEMCGSTKPILEKNTNKTAASPDVNDMKRVEVESDNNCLFRIIGYLLENKSMDKVDKLRNLISEIVTNNQEIYSEAVLGKPVTEYCSWIKRSSSWGGAIELSILAGYYKVEICAFNIQTATPLVFGEDKGYSKRIYLLYDGIHYDGITRLSRNGDEQTVFDSSDEPAFLSAQKLAKKAQNNRQFTDVNNFTLKCEVCGKGVTGQEDAMKHAESTGHQQFSQY